MIRINPRNKTVVGICKAGEFKEQIKALEDLYNEKVQDESKR